MNGMAGEEGNGQSPTSGANSSWHSHVGDKIVCGPLVQKRCTGDADMCAITRIPISPGVGDCRSNKVFMKQCSTIGVCSMPSRPLSS